MTTLRRPLALAFLVTLSSPLLLVLVSTARPLMLATALVIGAYGLIDAVLQTAEPIQ